MEWLWPILAAQGLVLVASLMLLLLRMSSDVRDIKTDLKHQRERCELVHGPIAEKLTDHQGRLGNHSTRIGNLESKYGIRVGPE